MSPFNQRMLKNKSKFWKKGLGSFDPMGSLSRLPKTTDFEKTWHVLKDGSLQFLQETRAVKTLTSKKKRGQKRIPGKQVESEEEAKLDQDQTENNKNKETI